MLTADINMRGESLPVIAEFSGIIDGDGHTVVDAILTANAVEAGDYYGFIGVNTGTVKNLTFSRIGYSVSSYGAKYSCKVGNTWGVIAGCNKGTIENVDLLSSTAMLAPTAWTVSASVYFGCIAGVNEGSITGCDVTADMSSDAYGAQGDYSARSFNIRYGGVAGVNGAGGHVVGCSVTGSVVSKNAVYGEIMLNVGNSFWTAGGSVLGNIIFSTQLNIVQSVTFGGLVGMNAGEVSDCKATGSVNVYSYADANLVMLKGKLNVKTELYAGSLIGYNTGEATGNSAPAISYEVPSEYKHIGVPQILPGNAYELTYEIVNHGSDGNGKIGVDEN